MSSPIYQAIKQISDEKNIPVEAVIETIEAALAAAYRKDFGEKNQNVKITFDAETGNFDVFDVKTVVEDMELPPEDEEGAEPAPVAEKAPMPPAEPVAPLLDENGLPIVEKKFNPKTEIMVTAAQEIKPGVLIGEEIITKLGVPAAFGRMAAQTAKQVITQKLREVERNQLFTEFKDRIGELVNATVQRREGRVVLVDLGHVTAIMPPEEQIATERYMPGDRVKVYITDVRLTGRGPEVVVSRANPDIVRRLFTLEIPEVASGVVKLHAIAREAGSRSKVAVSSTQENVDPIGSCIGQRGTRIQTIIAELGGEKVDIIQHDDDAVRFISHALSPAKVVSIALNEEGRFADVLVAEDQLSLAIGKGGQNVRLASRLTGWKINIRPAGLPAGDAAAPDAMGDAPEDAAKLDIPDADAVPPAGESAPDAAAMKPEGSAE